MTAPQLSDTVGVVSVTLVAPHRPGEATTVTSAGQVMEGGWLSVTITSCGQVAVLPCASVPVRITVLSPPAQISGAFLIMGTTAPLSKTYMLTRLTYDRRPQTARATRTALYM